MVYDLAPTFDNKHVVVVNERAFVVDMITLEEVHSFGNHSDVVPWCAITDEGKYIVTRSYAETNIWKTSDFSHIVKIQETCAIVISAHRLTKAFLHDGLFKIWSPKILRDFSDEIEIAEDDEPGNPTSQQK